MAAAGLVTGLLGVVLGVLWVVGIAALVNNADVQQLLDPLGDRLSQLPELRP